MAGVVSPVDHKYDEPALDVKFTFSPSQKVVGPSAMMVGVAGKAFTVTTVATDAADWHPLALVTFT
jgi:hypothetical protein